MNKDEVWERIKKDKGEIYGEPMLDVFLKTVDELGKKHLDELPPQKRRMVSPDTRLRYATTVNEAEQAIKDGAKNLEGVLYGSAQTGDLEILKVVFEKIRTSPEWQRPEGQASWAFHVAAGAGQLQVCEFLADKGVVVFNSSMSTAVQGGHLEVVRFLLDKGAKVTRWLLGSAAEKGHLEVCKLLLDRGRNDVEQLDYALGLAARSGDLAVCKMLVDSGAKGFDDALYNAAINGHLKIVKLMAEKGATKFKRAFEATSEWLHPELKWYLQDKLKEQG
jgi:hypothetical protein